MVHVFLLNPPYILNTEHKDKTLAHFLSRLVHFLFSLGSNLFVLTFVYVAANKDIVSKKRVNKRGTSS